jgi:hypothetical protein
VVPAGRGLRARRLHRIALVHLLRRFSRSLCGLESRPVSRGAGRTISRGCGDKKSGESDFIWEGRAEKEGRSRENDLCSNVSPCRPVAEGRRSWDSSGYRWRIPVGGRPART